MDRGEQAGVATAAGRAGPRHFSLSAANRALVLVRRIVTDLVVEYCRFLELQEIFELEQAYAEEAPLEDFARDVADAVRRIREYSDELRDVGVELRDMARGIVDFPAVIGGRAVCFCWELGQERIEYWHDRGEALAHRRPVAELADLSRASAQTG